MPPEFVPEAAGALVDPLDVDDIERGMRRCAELSVPNAAAREADLALYSKAALAAELRAGQAVRARRSDLILEPVEGFGLGRFVVHGNGKKHGEVVDLHPELRALVDETLATGYLSDAEIAYRWEEIPDYYLFPAGRLRRGKVRVDLAKLRVAGPKNPKPIRVFRGSPTHEVERLPSR